VRTRIPPPLVINPRWGTHPVVCELSVPTLLIVGEHDEPCVKVHRFMADTIPGARHVLIPGVGHLTNLEAPDAFNRAVTTFLREAARRTRATKRRPRAGAARPGRRRRTGSSPVNDAFTQS